MNYNRDYQTMTTEELIEFQKIIHESIKLKARCLNYEQAEPIFDGVCDAEKYLNSSPKIMWILKEAYDDKDENDNPIGGGMPVFVNWKDSTKVKEVASVRTWQQMMYIMHAFRESKNWHDIPWIRDNYEEYIERLQECAYININKMPAKSKSGYLMNEFNVWKDIINTQILGYAPDVIVFGNTFEYFRNSNQIYISDQNICNERPGIQGITGVFETEIGGHKTILIDAFHPAQTKLTGQIYVDTILTSIRRYV